MATITLTDLQHTAKIYQKDLRMLPYAAMLKTLAEHRITLFPGVANEDTVVEFLRKRGIMRPYAVGMTISNADIGKLKESVLKVELAYASMVDNIQNYKEKTIISPDEMIGANKTKKHPFHLKVMMAMIQTFGEDVLDAIWHGERNTSDQSPLGAFNGFDYHIDAAISAGTIAAGEGNYITGHTFAAPSSESDFAAYTALRTWLRSVDPNLLQGSVLYLPRTISNNVLDACKNKIRAAGIVDSSVLESVLNDDVDGSIKIVRSRIMGTGDRIVLAAEGNLDFGMNSMGDEDFVQIRPAAGGDDPNNIYYWIQASYGTRIRSFNKKVFAVNDGTPVVSRISGDYIS